MIHHGLVDQLVDRYLGMVEASGSNPDESINLMLLLEKMDHKSAILYGIAIWAVVFIIAILAFPLRANDRPLFESIMPVALTIATVVASVKYFKKVDKNFIAVGLCLGIIWLAVNISIDLLMFMQGPMKMSLMDYIKDIGLTYMLIPAITIGFGYAIERK